MLKFLLFMALAFLTLRLVIRLTGGWLMRVIMQKAAENMQKQYINTENSFHQRYDPDFESEYMVNPNLKVKVPRENASESAAAGKKAGRRGIDDVDFEETRD